jgi:FkbM family methyltransferase
MIKKFIIYIISILPIDILSKLENLFSIAQGKGFSDPKIESEIVLNFFHKRKIILNNIFDVGSHKGLYIDQFKKKFQNIHFFLFEPDKKNYFFLKKKYKNENNMNILNYAISDKNTNSIFYSYGKGSLEGSLINRDYSHLNLKNNIKQNVKVRRLDNIFLSLNLNNIDLIKLDIEGNEFKALEGIGKYLNKVKIIQFEFGQANIDSRIFFKDYYEFFIRNNFLIYRITPIKVELIKNWSENLEHFRVTNYLAVNNSINNL